MIFLSLLRTAHLRLAITGCAVVAATASIASRTQSPVTGATFDVVSVKPLLDNRRPFNAVDFNFIKGVAKRPTNGRLQIPNTPVSLLIELAYGIDDTRLVGAPAWVRNDHYAVEARTVDRATFNDIQPMLRAMLADRFKLAVRHETRVLPIYELIAANGGLRIAAAQPGSCTPDRQRSGEPGGPVTMCDGKRRYQRDQTIRLEGASVTMSGLIEMLLDDVDRPIVDRTSFAAPFDLHLEFAPSVTAIRDASAAAMSDPTLFTALQEQLGLRLRSTRGPADVLVITHIEPATPD